MQYGFGRTVEKQTGGGFVRCAGNYAANYYETGGTELDLSGAVQILREKRKKTDRFIREEADKEDGKYRKCFRMRVFGAGYG